MHSGKKVLVVGVARSGIGAAKLLYELGAEVTINDIKPLEELNSQLVEVSNGINIKVGCKADELIAGMDLVVVSPGIPASLSLFSEAKALGVPVIGEVELAYTLCKGKIAAITGTNGKTTTTALTGAVFKEFSENTFIAGNIGEAFSNVVLKTDDKSLTALEVSSFQLETIDKFHPNVAAVLNITEDHLARHGSMTEYIRCKKRIFENQGRNDFLILNYDDPATREMSKDCKCTVIYFSKGSLEDKCACIENSKVVIKSDTGFQEICDISEIPIPGQHNLENVLAAAAISYFMGVDCLSIRKGILNFKAVEHRLEFIADKNGIRYVNDSKGTNTDATIVAVKAMDAPTIIILGGYDKGSEFDSLVEAFTDNIKGAVIIGETKEKIVYSLEKKGFDNYITADGFEEAVHKAGEMAEQGYTVLLSPACASFDMFKDFEQRGKVFKEIVGNIKQVL
ncbi:MAG: UDP-N-acetylmuramoyl-L-alanine--D-glutamate ligase [Clostridia bacterium]|nr:UDP-N-acetylmuramoyl-L-alanine--D-glutamate ligase [Clostridia bacterium]